MKVECVALSDFIHGDIDAREGRVCRHRNGDLLDSGIAGDLERAGLVRIRTAPREATPIQPDPENKTEAGKAPDDGLGQPSSVSPVAPPSPEPMSGTLRLGGGRIRRSGA